MDVDPAKPGWYGLIFGDGAGEVWVGAGYWNGEWHNNVSRAYARSNWSFGSVDEAWKWASMQND